MSNKIILGIVVLAALATSVYVIDMKREVVVTNFEECAQAGYPIMESYPEQCRDPEGNVYVRNIDNPPAPGPANPNPTPTPVACTAEARLCPNGSYVGRTGPNCEFAPCPSTPPPVGVYCTQEAMRCPDGSYVGRTGPNCEFSLCPTAGSM